MVNTAGVVLGMVEPGAAGDDPDRTVEEVMSEGPATFRPDVATAEMSDHLDPGRKDPVLVTTSEGRLVGLVDPQMVLVSAEEGES